MAQFGHTFTRQAKTGLFYQNPESDFLFVWIPGLPMDGYRGSYTGYGGRSKYVRVPDQLRVSVY